MSWWRGSSVECLGGLLESVLDEGEAALGLFAQKLFVFAAIAKSGVKFIGDGQGGEDGRFLGVHGAGGVGDGAHFFIDIGSEFLHVGGCEFACDGISLAEDLDFGRGHVTRRRGRQKRKLAQKLRVAKRAGAQTRSRKMREEAETFAQGVVPRGD
jgi:hypothetical protein